ncbi:MAG TPA: cytochrome c maturation protein CcmE [Crenotrichaceae bacterium]|nr:cytochrome c maturation protein CcmE [Crenotrichaceae bacterium]
MKPIRRQRLLLIIAMVAAIMGSVAFALKAFNENLMYFYSVTQVANGESPDDQAFRLGGMVVEGSVKRPGEGLTVVFDLTDYQSTVTVKYTGILPDLFREGQGIISTGRLDADGVFIADEVLAKHDENYMPPEVADSLKQSDATNQTGLNR